MEEQSREDVTHTIRYRSFFPFRKAETFEFLFGLRVNGKTDGSDWIFDADKDGWALKAEGVSGALRPEQDTPGVSRGKTYPIRSRKVAAKTWIFSPKRMKPRRVTESPGSSVPP